MNEELQAQVDQLAEDFRNAMAAVEPSAIGARIESLQTQIDHLALSLRELESWRPEVAKLHDTLSQLHADWATFRRNQ